MKQDRLTVQLPTHKSNESVGVTITRCMRDGIQKRKVGILLHVINHSIIRLTYRDGTYIHIYDFKVFDAIIIKFEFFVGIRLQKIILYFNQELHNISLVSKF